MHSSVNDFVDILVIIAWDAQQRQLLSSPLLLPSRLQLALCAFDGGLYIVLTKES
jgi:hypothetical protein